MAAKIQLGGSGSLFVGEDKILRLELLTPATHPTTPNIPVDMAGWEIKLVIAPNDKSPEADFLVDLTATVTGVYDADRTVNTQRAVATLTDDLTNLFTAKTKAPHFRYAWKRMDAGSETVLAYGDAVFEKAPPL